MQTAKSILITGFIVAFFSTCLVSYAEDVREGIIFVDQSGSVKKHDDRLKSRTLLIEFLKTLKRPFRIVLAGFNEQIHERTSVVTETEADIEALAGEIQKIDARSYSTDLEIPFRYLLERDGKEAIEFALIISDGEPDIWDGKLRHFSKRVKSDPRYEDLNKEYRTLKASGLSPDELFARLRNRYHERNLELIEEQLSRLRDGLGDKIILWDVSGESRFLRSWSEKCGAQYLAMTGEEDVISLDHLRNAMLSLPEKSSFIVHDPSSEVYEPPLESALPVAVEQKTKTGFERPGTTGFKQKPERAHTKVSSKAPSPDLDDAPKKSDGLAPRPVSEEGLAGWIISAAVALFVLISGGGIIMLGKSRKSAARAKLKRELEVDLEDKIRSARERKLAEMEDEIAAEKERRKEELAKELSGYRRSVELELEAEKERRMGELEARKSEMVSGVEAETAERRKQLEAETESEISSIKERRLAEMEAEIGAEKERRMEEFEKKLSEYWKSVEVEVEAEKKRRLQELEARSRD